MGFEQTGKLHTILETNRVSERFTKREFVVEVADNPKYPQLVMFQLTGDRCGQLDDLRVGDEVRVEFSLRGREWKSPKGEIRWFNSLDAWKVEPVRAAASRIGGGVPSDEKPNYGGAGPDSDLPFISASLSDEPHLMRKRGVP